MTEVAEHAYLWATTPHLAGPAVMLFTLGCGCWRVPSPLWHLSVPKDMSPIKRMLKVAEPCHFHFNSLRFGHHWAIP